MFSVCHQNIFFRRNISYILWYLFVQYYQGNIYFYLGPNKKDPTHRAYL